MTKDLNKRFKDTDAGAWSAKKYLDQFELSLDKLATQSAKRRGSIEKSDSDYDNAFRFLVTPPPKHRLSFPAITGRLLYMSGSIFLGMGFSHGFAGNYVFVAFLLIIGGYCLEEK